LNNFLSSLFHLISQNIFIVIFVIWFSGDAGAFWVHFDFIADGLKDESEETAYLTGYQAAIIFINLIKIKIFNNR
jgi:hypothetical protein